MLARLGNNDQLVILKKPFDTMEVLQLANALTEKWRLHQEVGLKLEQLEQLVQKRTSDLRSTNESLQTEILVRKDAEARIREQARMLDLAHDAIHVRDLDGRIRYWNKSAERLYGWTSTEVLGARLADLCRADAADLEKERKARALVEQGDWSGELNHLTKSGRPFLVHSRWTLVRDPGGRPQSILVIDTDITEKKKLEAQFLHAQRMDSIGTLAIGIAHDLNNILAPVMMIGPLLRAEIKDRATLGLLDSMEASAQRGADIVKQILTFARGVKGAKAPLQTFRLLKEFSGFIRETFPNNIALNFAVPKDLWMVEGNSTELHQVLVNLCLNAREAMPRGGALTLSALNLTLDENAAAAIPNATAGRYVVWTVADTGVGIASQEPGPRLRSIFHHQGSRQRPRPGPVHRPRHRAQLRRLHSIEKPVGPRHRSQYLSPRRRRRHAPARPNSSPNRPAAPANWSWFWTATKPSPPSSKKSSPPPATASWPVPMKRKPWNSTVATGAQIGVVLADLMMPDMEKVISALRQINPAVNLVASSTRVSRANARLLAHPGQPIPAQTLSNQRPPRRLAQRPGPPGTLRRS